MKFTQLWCCLTTAVIFLSSASLSRGQGTITFNEPWVYEGYIPYRDYYEQGMWFRVEVPPSHARYYFMRRTGSTHSQNGTPFLAWVNDGGLPDYVAFSREDESLFGLISVDLRNIGSSLQPALDITFNGFKADGAMVSQTFTTPLNDFTTFTTFQFGPEFASGLSHVEIPTRFWSMDNLVWIPEPRTYALLGLGLLVIALGKLKRSPRR